MSLQDWMQPEVLVLDMDDGYVVDEIARACANLRAKVLVLTTNGERGFVHRLMLAGVRGVLQKREPPSALLHAIEAVGRGHVSVPQAGGGKASMLRPPPARPAQDELGRMGLLTERERETIAALVTDVSAPAKVIAAQLRMSEHTLRNHLTSIYSKLGVSGRVALYALAKERHLIRRVTAWGDSEQ